jgi:hypothetical protein
LSPKRRGRRERADTERQVRRHHEPTERAAGVFSDPPRPDIKIGPKQWNQRDGDEKKRDADRAVPNQANHTHVANASVGNRPRCKADANATSAMPFAERKTRSNLGAAGPMPGSRRQERDSGQIKRAHEPGVQWRQQPRDRSLDLTRPEQTPAGNPTSEHHSRREYPSGHDKQRTTAAATASAYLYARRANSTDLTIVREVVGARH